MVGVVDNFLDRSIEKDVADVCNLLTVDIMLSEGINDGLAAAALKTNRLEEDVGEISDDVIHIDLGESPMLAKVPLRTRR